MNEFLDYLLLGNTVRNWLIAISIFVGICLLVRFLKYIIIGRLAKFAQKSSNQLDDFLIEVIGNSVVPMLYILAVYAGMHYLEFPKKTYNAANVVLMVILTFFALRMVTHAIKFAVYRYLDRQEEAEMKKRQARGILAIVNIVVWILGLVFLLDNLGRNVTTIIAGLGVGGIAIALAAQTILGDLFSYFVIFFDRPFEIGDSIAVDNKSGKVEYIGIKTTRLRTVTGDLLVISNTNLTNSRVHNFKKLQERGTSIKFTVVYQTPYDKVKAIPGYVKDIITAIDKVRFERCHFVGYGVNGLDFDTAYVVESSEYDIHMDRQEEILLAIYKKFEEDGIQLFYVNQAQLVAVASNKPPGNADAATA